MSGKDTGAKELINGLVDQLAEPSVTEPIGCVWDEVADDSAAMPNSLSDAAVAAFRDALRPGDGLGATTQWTSRDWAKAAVTLAAWSRSKGLSTTGKSWIQKAGGTAPESADAGAKELSLVLYKKLLEPVRPGAAADRLSARQRALLAAFLAKTAKDIGVNLSERSDRKALNETPDAFVGELIRRGLLEKGVSGGPGSVVSNWPAVLDDAARYRDSFWQELRELIEPAGRAALPTAAGALLVAALVIGLVVTWVQGSKKGRDLEQLTTGIKAEFAKEMDAGKAPLVSDYLAAVGKFKKDVQARDAAQTLQISNLTAESASFKGKLDDTVATTTKKINDLDAGRTAALKARDAAREEGDALKKQVEALTADKTKLTGDLAKAVKEAAEVLTEKNKVIETTTASLKTTTGERDKLKTDLTDTTTKLTAATTKLAATEKTLGTTAKSLSDAEAKIKQKDLDLTNLNEGLRSASAKLTAAAAKQADTDKSLAAAKTELTAAAAKQADTDKALAAAKKSAADDAAKAGAALTASDAKVKSLTEAGAKAATDLAAAEAKAKTAAAAAAKAASDLADAKKKSDAEVKTLQDDLKSVTKERDDLKKKVAEGKVEPKSGAAVPAGGNRGKDAAKGELLGAVVRNILDEDRKALSLAADVKGVIVHAVKAGSPAAAAGLKADDVVTELRADFAVGTQTVSQDTAVGDLAGVTAFSDRVATLKRDNKLKAWRIKTVTRSITINE